MLCLFNRNKMNSISLESNSIPNVPIVSVDEFIRLVQTIGKDTALEYLKCVVAANVKTVPVDDCNCDKVPTSVTEEKTAPSSISENSKKPSMPSVKVTSSIISSKRSVKVKSTQELLELHNKTGYCYTQMLARVAYERRVRAMGAWPDFVTLLRMSYVDTIGIDDLRSYYIKSVDRRGRYHLTLECTDYPLLDVLYTVSYGFNQRVGSLGFHLHAGEYANFIQLEVDMTLASRLGGMYVYGLPECIGWFKPDVNLMSKSFIQFTFGKGHDFNFTKFVELLNIPFKPFGFYVFVDTEFITVIVRLNDVGMHDSVTMFYSQVRDFHSLSSASLWECYPYVTAVGSYGKLLQNKFDISYYKVCAPIGDFSVNQIFTSLAQKFNHSLTFHVSFSPNLQSFFLISLSYSSDVLAKCIYETLSSNFMTVQVVKLTDNITLHNYTDNGFLTATCYRNPTSTMSTVFMPHQFGKGYSYLLIVKPDERALVAKTYGAYPTVYTLLHTDKDLILNVSDLNKLDVCRSHDETFLFCAGEDSTRLLDNLVFVSRTIVYFTPNVIGSFLKHLRIPSTYVPLLSKDSKVG